jgi:hypothetical protein
MADESPGYWIAVASAEHVRRGCEGGFMQVCHGKGGPLSRIRPGDGVVYYSPSTVFRVPDGLQSFTAIGRATEGPPYQHDMGGGLVPFRRDMSWSEAREVPIRPLLDQMAFTRGRSNWGHAFRFGVLRITAADFAVIRDTMRVQEPASSGLRGL